MNEHEEELSYEEIFEELINSSEIEISCLKEDVERFKRGLKNHKSYQNKKAKLNGVPMEDLTLSFKVEPSSPDEDFVDVTVSLEKRATILIRRKPTVSMKGELKDE